MTRPHLRSFRLVARGGPGLSCDKDGVALGDVPLVWQAADRDRFEVRPRNELSKVLRAAYGEQSPDVVRRCERGLARAAVHLQTGDLALASMEAVMIGFPDVAPLGMGNLARLTDLTKAGTAWQTESRVPQGQPGGGQWTTGDGGPPPGEAGSGAPKEPATPQPAQANQRSPLLDSGVYLPDADHPALVQTAGEESDAAYEGFRQGIGGNEPPYDHMELSDLFPGMKNEPGIAIPMAPIDSFLGASAR